MVDANEGASRSDSVSTVTAGSISIPTLVLNASVTFLVSIGLAVAAVAAQMSRPFLLTAVVLAVVGGCGVLSALVASHTRKTALETRQVIIDTMTAHATQSETDLCDIKTALAKVLDQGAKNKQAVSRIATGLADCKVQITGEVEKLRVAQYAIAAEGMDAKPGRRFPRAVDN